MRIQPIVILAKQ